MSGPVLLAGIRAVDNKYYLYDNAVGCLSSSLSRSMLMLSNLKVMGLDMSKVAKSRNLARGSVSSTLYNPLRYSIYRISCAVHKFQIQSVLNTRVHVCLRILPL
jgi:hypothetical protein